MQVNIVYLIYSEIQKAAFKIIDLNAEIKVFAIMVKGLILETVEIDRDGRYTEIVEIDLIKQDIMD